MANNRIGEVTKDRLLATGGVLGAVGASSCCVLPLAFAAAGISGAWIGALTRLAPFQPAFLAIAALCIGFGLWRTHGRNSAVCEEAACGTPASRRATKAVLWIAAAMLVVAGSVEWWARLLA
jgi:mercuric ion transport protein